MGYLCLILRSVLGGQFVKCLLRFGGFVEEGVLPYSLKECLTHSLMNSKLKILANMKYEVFD